VDPCACYPVFVHNPRFATSDDQLLVVILRTKRGAYPRLSIVMRPLRGIKGALIRCTIPRSSAYNCPYHLSLVLNMQFKLLSAVAGLAAYVLWYWQPIHADHLLAPLPCARRSSRMNASPGSTLDSVSGCTLACRQKPSRVVIFRRLRCHQHRF
jgi:hypothetical protein